MLSQYAAEYAAAHGIDYAIPGIIANIFDAGKQGGS
jgi:hypothetical protein